MLPSENSILSVLKPDNPKNFKVLGNVANNSW